eukprot:TRINITY_DN3161_c0_g1_i1.p1 TRINITY_DN3161_c0_g1~~TRINITY_DN3161_c0_g1_i1.p1  ORF type:complete len:258 (+),score=72.96 TRINITY_DN3161_c0_g1_i1:140-913(+)
MSSACSRAFGGLLRRSPVSIPTVQSTARLAPARFPTLAVRANSTESAPKPEKAWGNQWNYYNKYRSKQFDTLNYLKQIAPAWIKEVQLFDTGDVYIEIPRQKLPQVLDLLRHHTNFQYEQCMDIYSIDWPEKEERFEVQYVLLSVRYASRIILRLTVPQDVMVPSATCMYDSANWLEREVYDMMGIIFSDHPDLRRILTDYGFQGFPLRKDFPLSGYTEVRYDDELKRVVQEPVELSQEFRAFDFATPWEKLQAQKA